MDVLAAGRPARSRTARRNGRGMGALCRGHGAAHGRRVRRRRTLSGPGFPRRGREAPLGAPPVQAQDTGTVRGTVTLVENDDPVDGAVVLVLGAGAFTFTDEGTFEITSVPVGSYVVTAQREHLTTDRQTVTVCTWTSAPAPGARPGVHRAQPDERALSEPHVVHQGSGPGDGPRGSGGLLATVLLIPPAPYWCAGLQAGIRPLVRRSRLNAIRVPAKLPS